jgi:peptidoglycan/LPS O-acetylase OafA/YrhL
VWPALFVFASCAFVVFQFARYNRVPLANYLGAISFTYNYLTLFLRAGVLNHIWSLAVEEHTYLVLGALAWLARRHGVRWRPVMLGVAGFCLLNGAFQTWVLHIDMTHVYWRTDVAMASILMGAIGWLWWSERKPAVPAALPPAALGLALLLNHAAFPAPIRYGLGTALLAVAVATLERAPRALLRALCAPALVQVGVWSYSLYLWQQPFYVLKDKLPLPLMVAGAAATSLLSFYVVEQPARRFLNARYGGHPRPPDMEPVPL